MSSDVEHSCAKETFSCSTCWKVFLDKDICMEHMLGHVSDSNGNIRTEISRDGDSRGSGTHKTDDKNDDYDYCNPAYAENRSVGMFHGNDKTQSYMVINEGVNEASMAEKVVGNTRKRTNGFKCKKNMSKRTICKHCNLNCGDSANLFKHEKVHKTVGKKIYVCEICNKQFTIRYRYLVHSKIHNDDRAFQCEICKKRFIEKTHLTTHMRYHTKSDLLYCDICRREFIKESALAKHMEVHSDDRPHKCKYCPSSFKREQHLIRHQSKHSASRPRPFRCDKCGIAYLDRLGLSRHIKHYHNEKRDVIQTNFKTRNVKAALVGCGSVGNGLESTMFEPVESESENRITASTLLELAGGYPQPASVPAYSGSVNIISVSGLPLSSSASVEHMISTVDGSKIYKIITLAEDNALSNVSEVPLALTLETQCSTIVTADSSEVPFILPPAAQSSTVLTGSSEVPFVLHPAARNSTVLTGSSEVPLALPPAARNSTVLTGSSEVPLRAAQRSIVMTAESSVVPSPLPLAPQRFTGSSEVPLALPLEVHSSFVIPADSTESFEVPSTTTLHLPTQSSTNSSEIPLALPLEAQGSSVMTPASSEVLSSMTLPTATARSTVVTDNTCKAPLEVQSSFVKTAEHSVVSSPMTVPLSTQSSTVQSDSLEVSRALPLEVQSSFVMRTESFEVPSTTTLPLAAQSSTNSSEIQLALPLETQDSFVITPEVLSSVTLPLETQSSTVLDFDYSEVSLMLHLAAECSMADPSKVPLTVPLATQSSPLRTADDSSEFSLTVPLEAHSSLVMTAESSEEAFSFKNDRTGLVSLQTGVHNSSDMPHLDTSLPLSTSELVCLENFQSDVQETYYIEIVSPPVSETSTTTVSNGSFSDVFKKVPPTNAIRKRKSTTNFPQRVDVKQKRCEVPHTLWTYM